MGGITPTPTPTPVRKTAVPGGHVLAAIKWKGMELTKKLSDLGPVTFTDSMGLIDFQPSSESAIVYLMESDIICGNSYQSNLIKLRKADCMRIVVLFEKTTLTEPYFQNIQHFVVLLLGLKLIPVSSTSIAAQFIHEMAVAESKSHLNPFTQRNTGNKPESQQIMLKLMQEIPGVDENRAQSLLQRFSTIQNICNATKQELSQIVGTTRAENIKNFISSACK